MAKHCSVLLLMLVLLWVDHGTGMGPGGPKPPPGDHDHTHPRPDGPDITTEPPATDSNIQTRTANLTSEEEVNQGRVVASVLEFACHSCLWSTSQYRRIEFMLGCM